MSYPKPRVLLLLITSNNLHVSCELYLGSGVKVTQRQGLHDTVHLILQNVFQGNASSIGLSIESCDITISRKVIDLQYMFDIFPLSPNQVLKGYRQNFVISIYCSDLSILSIRV